MPISHHLSLERKFMDPDTLNRQSSSQMESHPDSNGQTNLTSYSRFMHQHTQRQISALGDRLQEAKDVGRPDTSSSSDETPSSSGTGQNESQRNQQCDDH